MARQESRKLVASAARPAAVVFHAAEADFALGKWRPALAGYAAVAIACPGHLRARLRVADALLNLGHQELARDVYRAVVDFAARAGHPLVALVAIKLVQLLEPGAEDVVGVLAERYAAGSPRLDALFAGPVPVSAGDEAAVVLVDDEHLPQAAARAAVDREGALADAPILPVVPLFSYLDEDAFTAVIECVRLRRFSDEEVVIRQGDRSESVFMIADGEVAVQKGVDDDDGGVTLARLRRGAVFGELSLISDEPRLASVIARGDVDLLEVRRSDVIVAAATTDGVSSALRQFTRERFLRNLTATHPFFSPLGKDDRHRVMEVTNIITFKAGDVLIQEGRRGPGLFVLLGGQALVKKKATAKIAGDDVEFIHLATLRGGDLCGEMSMLNDAPTNATVTCAEDLEALFLSRDAFKSVTSEHPELLRYLASVTDERLRHNRALLQSRSLFEDDEHVMI